MSILGIVRFLWWRWWVFAALVFRPTHKLLSQFECFSSVHHIHDGPQRSFILLDLCGPWWRWWDSILARTTRSVIRGSDRYQRSFTSAPTSNPALFYNESSASFVTWWRWWVFAALVFRPTHKLLSQFECFSSVHHIHDGPQRSSFLWTLEVHGGDDGIRTHDPLLAGQVLSQLSYTPVLKVCSCFSVFPRLRFRKVSLLIFLFKESKW